MASLGFVEAFAKFGAKLDNPMWAVSAIANDGALVISCWDNYFRKSEKGTLCYFDCLSRWKGNELGNKLLRTHLTKAQSENLPIRMVVARAKKPELLETTTDASKIEKTFHIKHDVVGKLTKFDGDNFVIEFTKP